MDYPFLCPNCQRGHLKIVSLALRQRAWMCENCKKVFKKIPPEPEPVKEKFNPSKRDTER